ncbi:MULTISPECIES: DMT family transporter [Marinobacterium]|uniref:Threonine/homoserine efflux transporter RhtA n=2 Tax=Marinobacterium TaxID=48075 RepID=A0A1H5X7A6_9GAMM|nr:MULTISPECIES: DMT family transporter [Marinobacterium]TCK08706.1 threonine/homoserine efflux transporter RhtA [Marinobacterium mangrovicola]SEG07176.1 Threonine/homoserine efflux transporter RhtA [Marinobacterium lutimaris]
MTLSNHVKADILLLITTFLAGAGWIMSKEALAGFAPLLFISMRFALAGLILLPINARALARLSSQQWKGCLLVGLFFGCGMVFWVLGLKIATHIGVGAFLASLGVVLVPLLGVLFGDRPGRYVYYSLPCVVAGLACLSLDSTFSIGLGELCFLGAAFFLALMFIMNSKASSKTPVGPLTTVQLLVTGAITLLVSAIFETWYLPQTGAVWGWFVASVLIGTILRFSIQTRGQSMAPISHAAIIMTLEPVWAALMAAFWLGDSMSAMQIAGCGLIFLAMLVNRWPAIRAWFGIKGAA